MKSSYLTGFMDKLAELGKYAATPEFMLTPQQKEDIAAGIAKGSGTLRREKERIAARNEQFADIAEQLQPGYTTPWMNLAGNALWNTAEGLSDFSLLKGVMPEYSWDLWHRWANKKEQNLLGNTTGNSPAKHNAAVISSDVIKPFLSEGGTDTLVFSPLTIKAVRDAIRARGWRAKALYSLMAIGEGGFAVNGIADGLEAVNKSLHPSGENGKTPQQQLDERREFIWNTKDPYIISNADMSKTLSNIESAPVPSGNKKLKYWFDDKNDDNVIYPPIRREYMSDSGEFRYDLGKGKHNLFGIYPGGEDYNLYPDSDDIVY